ncbi:hypothetical protein [Limnobacter sp.]|uniref:hypothetical protein n=1 Tax=Limnobacter sp. TaxID=2003368 RepID=UPI0035132F5F
MQATQNIFTSINGEGPCPSTSLRFKQPKTPTEKAVAALAERWHGLQVASSVISLDSKNVSAWSMAYQLLPDDSSTVRLVAGGEMRQLNRQQVDHAMFDIINGRG